MPLPPTVHFFCAGLVANWYAVRPALALGLLGNSAPIHEYCPSVRSLAHELFMNTYVVGHGYYYIDIISYIYIFYHHH